MNRFIYHWLVTAVFCLLLPACITINQSNQYTELEIMREQETAVAPLATDIRPSPTPVAPFPGIVYVTSAGYWQINERGQDVRLAELPDIDSMATRHLADFGLEEETILNAFLSPDGNWLALTQLSATESPTVWLVARQNKERHLLGAGFDPVWSPDGRHLIYNTPGRPQLVLVSNDPYVIHMNLPSGSKVIGWLNNSNQ